MIEKNVYAGKRILVVEDDYFIAVEMTAWLEDNGAVVIGPAPTVKQAVSLIERGGDIDGAILDINLAGEMVFPVADVLLSGGVPFVFATGYDEREIPARYSSIPRVSKPVDGANLGNALFSS